ncbi:hypothetical protein CF067_16480 [Clostridium sporogenes]
MKNLFKEAHELTKEIKKEFPEVDYKVQFAICLSYLQKMKGDNKVVELIGSEKQIKWAKDIKKELIKEVEEYKERFNDAENFRINYLNRYKKEIFKRATSKKITMDEAIKILNSIIDEVKTNIENETSAKRLIEVKKSFAMADATTDRYLIKEFM